jgi:succinylglutamic semialdehyde dehydrogenase
MTNTFQLKGNFYHGQFHEVKKPEREIIKFSPANLNQQLWTLKISHEHISEVLSSAQAGFQVWRKTSLSEKVKLLKNYQAEILKRTDEIAMALALETGKPLQECKGEALGLAAKVDVTINDSLPRVENKLISEIMPGIDGHFNYKPLGPILIIGPFNFPCHLANGQIVSALLAGNSLIFKPSEKTAYAPQLMVECLHAAGFPKGVINLMQGDGQLTAQLVSSPTIRGIHFTGSKEVGAKIAQSVATDFTKLLALELGGKNSTLIHEDANLDHALAECINACFLTSGQRCTSTSLIFIHKKLLLKFQKEFVEVTKKIQVGHPLEGNPFMGPLIDEHAEKLYAFYQAKAIEEGAHILLPAQQLKLNYPGHYWSPSIYLYDQKDQNKSFIKQEIFAPNVTLIPYEDVSEAINTINQADYGLSFAAFTQSEEVAKLCLNDVEAGILNINRSTVGASARLPFGGCKNSGNFRPAGVTMIDSCVQLTSSLTTMTHCNSNWRKISGLST